MVVQLNLIIITYWPAIRFLNTKLARLLGRSDGGPNSAPPYPLAAVLQWAAPPPPSLDPLRTGPSWPSDYALNFSHETFVTSLCCCSEVDELAPLFIKIINEQVLYCVLKTDSRLRQTFGTNSDLVFPNPHGRRRAGWGPSTSPLAYQCPFTVKLYEVICSSTTTTENSLQYCAIAVYDIALTIRTLPPYPHLPPVTSTNSPTKQVTTHSARSSRWLNCLASK